MRSISTDTTDTQQLIFTPDRQESPLRGTRFKAEIAASPASVRAVERGSLGTCFQVLDCCLLPPLSWD